MQAIQRGTAAMVTDGGLDNQIGTFGVVFDWQKEEQLKTRGPADASRFSHDSPRPEMMGSCVGMKLHETLDECCPDRFSGKGTQLVAHADDDEAMQRSNHEWKCHSVVQQTRGEHDLEREIQTTRDDLKHVVFARAKGHQDRADKTGKS